MCCYEDGIDLQMGRHNSGSEARTGFTHSDGLLLSFCPLFLDHVPMFSKILSFYKFLSRGLVFHVRVLKALRTRLSTRVLSPKVSAALLLLAFSHQKLLPSVSKRGPGIGACGTSWWHRSPCVVASCTVPLGLWVGVCLVVWAFGLREGPEHRRPAWNCCFLCHPCDPTPGVTAAA